jgi:hypothetical protein
MNKSAHVVTLLACIRELPVSSPGQVTDIFRCCVCISSPPLGLLVCRSDAMNLVTTASFNTIYDSLFCIVTYRPIARQRPGKHTPAGANARNNRMSIARQRISKQALK